MVPPTYDHVGYLPKRLLGDEIRMFVFAFSKIDGDKLEIDILLLADEGDELSAGRPGVTVEFDRHVSCGQLRSGDRECILYPQSMRRPEIRV